MQDLENLVEAPLSRNSLALLGGLVVVSLLPSTYHLLHDGTATLWSSPLMLPLSLALCPLIALALVPFYILFTKRPQHPTERIALMGLLTCLVLAFVFDGSAFLSLQSSSNDAMDLLKSQQINAFSRSFVLCLATVFIIRFQSRHDLSQASKVWVMPVLVVLALLGLQLLDLRTGLFKEQLKTMVGITCVTSIFSSLLLAKIGWDLQKPLTLCLGWVAFLQIINQLLFLGSRTESLPSEVLLTQNLNDALAFLIPIPFVAKAILRHMNRPFSSIPSANRQLDSQGLNSAEAFAQGVAQAKSQLLSKLSHEFKTPLNTIIGYSELLVDELEESKLPLLSDDLHKVNRAGWYLMTLVDDLLDVSSLNDNAFQLRENAFDAERFMQVLQKMASKVAAPQLVQIETYCQQGFGIVQADEARLLQVCMNIIRNSVRYTHNGKISLHFYSIIKNNERFFSIDIRDSGRGIDPQELARIFSPFESIQNDSWESIYGLSMGLPVTKRLCELMGGTLSVDSTLGKGTTFSLTFPHLRNATPPQTIKENATLRDGPILLIDDDVEYAGFMREIFESAGLQTVTVYKGRTGLRIYLEQKPSVVVVDLKMPEIDGYMVIQSIRDQDPNCLIITVSGEGLDSSEEQSILAGSDQFFAKPMAVEAVLRHIEKRTKSAA